MSPRTIPKPTLLIEAPAAIGLSETDAAAALVEDEGPTKFVLKVVTDSAVVTNDEP